MDKLNNILLVEDNPTDVEMIKHVFESNNMQVYLSAVDDGVEAMAFLHKQDDYHDALRPDYVLLDLNLPKKDGFEVLSEIRADPQLKTIPVLILTSSGAVEDIQRTYELGANCYFTKATGLNEFFNLIETIQDLWGSLAKLPAESQNGY